ncbi:MAG: hypothetical protein SFY69_09285 [Planctomycetota bacterium]|nr:hypothetical protein [Planctomycetota bacterium]
MRMRAGRMMRAGSWVCAGALGLVGCGTVGSAGSLRVTSRGEERARFACDLPTRVFEPTSNLSADFFLTDLPREVWAEGGDASTVSGTIVHVNMFIVPKSGKTPIATGASTAAVRVLVLSQGELGVYGGGGFFAQSGDLNGESLGGSIRDGTVQLIRATPGFEDLLGPSFLSGSIGARRSAEDVAALRRAFNYLSSFGTPLDPPAQEP